MALRRTLEQVRRKIGVTQFEQQMLIVSEVEEIDCNYL